MPESPEHNENSLRNDIESAQSSWEVRAAMACAGWISEIRLTEMGTTSKSDERYFQVWFSRWDWHERRTDKVTFHSGVRVNAKDGAVSESVMLDAAKRAALRACDAWERFPKSVPTQGANGEVLVNNVATKYAFSDAVSLGHLVDNVDKKPDDLPHDHRMICDVGGDRDATLSPILLLATQGVDYEDKLTWMGGQSNQWDLMRSWQLSVSTTPRAWNGIRVAHRPQKITLGDISESFVSSAIEGLCASYTRLAELYKPGSHRGQLPPGWMTIAERQAIREYDARRGEVAEQEIEKDKPIPGHVISLLVEIWNRRVVEGSKNAALCPLLKKVTDDDVRRFVAAADVSLAKMPSIRQWWLHDILPPLDPIRTAPIPPLRNAVITAGAETLDAPKSAPRTPIPSLRSARFDSDEGEQTAEIRAEAMERLDGVSQVSESDREQAADRLMIPRASTLGLSGPPFVPPIHRAAAKLISLLEAGGEAPPGSDDLILNLIGLRGIGPEMPDGSPEFGYRLYPTDGLRMAAAAKLCALLPETAKGLGIDPPVSPPTP
jgi:hypothetical protein